MDELSEKEQSYEPIRLMVIELEQKKRAWLEKYGWKQSCDFVDSCWRWCKEIQGKMMMCDINTAIKIERDFLC